MEKKKYYRKHIGEVFVTKQGYEAVIIDGGSKSEYVTVRLGKFITEVNYNNLKNGVLKNPFHPFLYYKGFSGLGRFSSKSHRYFYTMWRHLFERCYDKKLQAKTHGTYSDVTTCEEWNNFQNFAKWCELNYPKNAKPNEFHIEKDLINPDTREYSPKNCIFVCQELNKFLTNIKKTNSSGCIGVHYDKRFNVWVTQIQVNGKRKVVYKGLDKEEACNTYKRYRAKYVKQLQAYYSFDYPKHILDNLK